MTIQGLACLLALAIVAACEAPAGGAWPRQGVADRKEAKPSATAVTASDLRLHASVERDSFLVPMRNGELFGWCLAQGFRVAVPETLMSQGFYQEPVGAFLPSVLY